VHIIIIFTEVNIIYCTYLFTLREVEKIKSYQSCISSIHLLRPNTRDFFKLYIFVGTINYDEVWLLIYTINLKHGLTLNIV